ncbi:MAG: glutamate-1-semialdehyde 2,1-aminomutase [Desulfomonile tiedjei]|uniref:Glutamate-1-semialdehyde 2,1-aminomutase n=1 Tax=Desulfomonile tiedjei TaxID=2358 RepID=A0A9D6V2L5_9BACT|nr:glutamate-1-semialdehyde 2,1-aminomutase [Desulfomonile tiedjei]
MPSNKSSESLFRQAMEVIPGGVNSPVRAFKSVGLPPRFIQSGKGARITDEDGNEFIDYVGSWGPLILGHAHPEVLQALEVTMQKGTSFGAPTRLEVEMARTIVEMVPSIDMVRLVSSGTEAVMSAIRLARGVTGRDKIIKFSGCYHGHSDSLLAKAGSGAATFGIPDSLGVPASVVQHTVVVPFNNLDAVRIEIEENPNRLAAVVVEPVAGNMGVAAPEPGFLGGLRELCTRDGALLIFDEVITGFRLGLGGAQGMYGVNPDITCLGKIIGGGLPVGAFGGRKDIMENLAPAGGVYQAGTLSGNPLAVAAGLTVLKILKRDNPYAGIEKRTTLLTDGLSAVLKEKGIAHTINQVGSMFSLFFHPGPVTCYEEALKSDREAFVSFFAGMLDRGIYLAPSPFEAWFVGAAHTDDDIDKTLAAARESL